MICIKKDHVGGENCATCVKHAVFKQMGERRKERGIALRQFKIMCEANAVASFNNFWNGWVETLGKEKATDLLLAAMRGADERLRAAVDQIPKRTPGKVKFERVSAPRVED